MIVKKAPLSFHRFLLRGRTLGLYREVMRRVYKIPSPQLRKEIRDYARGEFERERNVEDEEKIKYLISMGRKEMMEMDRYVGQL
ncbi:hypothetical protein BJ508DRAFT_365818 [Ascobolus immersus RN42]|uniref:LYR motif-containing protein 2 n=1 Tax=Ascobolus immersus RN42 TaxID=1160509 RepID=A0A3N4HT95_ASCIM|nr:hypothetical protein BJ508DRAFT_365818 [Ascobolus immersus RN42]